MPSNPYSGRPKVCLLCSTTGEKSIDLLNASGICITNPPGWIPEISQLKNSGIRIESQSMDDSQLVAGAYGSVTETLPLTVDPINTAARVQDLLHRLWLAEQFWFTGWQRGAVYLKVQLVEDSDLRYARIKTGAYQIGTYAFGGRTGLPNNTLVLERELGWQSVPPGEMIGPFRNMAKNPSFERWGFYGTADVTPSGWDVQEDANFPANPVLERERAIVAGDYSSLEMSFTGAGGAAPNEWYVWQRSRLLPDQDYTLKVWVKLTMGGGAGEEFFIRTTDSAGAVIYLNETFTTSQYGWHYLHFTTDREWFYQLLEIGFTAPATSVGSTAIIDRIFLTEGTWTSQTWPGNDDGFYMDSSIVWGFHEPEQYDYTRTLPYPVDRKCYLDIDNVPGDIDAQARIALEVEDKENFTTNIEVEETIKKLALFAEKNANEQRLLYFDVAGMSALGARNIGLSGLGWNLAEDTPMVIFTHQYNGDEVTQFLNHHFRVFIRYNTGKECTSKVSYWIGNPQKPVELSIGSLPVSPADFDLALANPVETINWRKTTVETVPASVGFSLTVENVQDAGAGDFWLDAIYLIPVDDGGVWVESNIAVGQGLALGSNSLSQPVQKAYNQSLIAFDSRPVMGTPRAALCARTFNEMLYGFYIGAAGAGEEHIFDGSLWDAASMTYAGGSVTSTELFDGMLYMGCDDGWIRWYDPNTDTTNGAGPYVAAPFTSIRQYNGRLHGAIGNVVSYYFPGGPVVVRNTGGNDALFLQTYKHQLWIGCQNGVTHWGDEVGWNVGPALPCGHDIVWMKEFQEKLYIACIDGDVYHWDGQTLVLSRTGSPANDDIAQQLEVFNNKFYLLTGGQAQNVVCLFETSDGITWSETFGVNCDEIQRNEICMEVYAGRLCILAERTSAAAGQWSACWHAPIVAALDIPDHTGSAIVLPPKNRTRLHILYSMYYLGYLAGPDYQQGANAIKIWILPRWRALRND